MSNQVSPISEFHASWRNVGNIMQLDTNVLACGNDANKIALAIAKTSSANKPSKLSAWASAYLLYACTSGKLGTHPLHSLYHSKSRPDLVEAALDSSETADDIKTRILEIMRTHPDAGIARTFEKQVETVHVQAELAQKDAEIDALKAQFAEMQAMLEALTKPETQDAPKAAKRKTQSKRQNVKATAETA